MSPAAPQATSPTPRHTALTLVLLLGLQPLSTDLYLPTLPQIGAGLHATPGLVQQTMSALLLAFGLSQLAWGPVSDRWGRRPALLAGLLVYLAASVVAAASPSIGVLVAMRALQGVGMAAAVVCGRAMVRDLYPPAQGAHVMTQALSGLGVIAVACPAVGGLLAWGVGWRGSFVFLGLVTAAYLAFVHHLVPESLPQPDRHALSLARLWPRWRRIVRHPTFWAYASLSAASYGGVFIFLASSSYVYITLLGLSPLWCGLLVATNSVAYVAGTWLCRRWLVRHGMAGAVRRAAWLTAAGGLSMAGCAAAGWQTVPALLLPQWLFALGHGSHQPCGQAGSVGPFPQEAGTAAALAGFLLAGTAFALGQWLSQAMDGTTRPTAYGTAACALLTVLIARTLVK